MARTKKTATLPQPTVTDEQYKELLATRLAAMHGFAEGTVDAETKNAARAAVRNARKVRKNEAELLEAHRQAELDKAAARSEAAKKAAATRKARKPATSAESVPEVTEQAEEVAA